MQFDEQSNMFMIGNAKTVQTRSQLQRGTFRHHHNSIYGTKYIGGGYNRIPGVFSYKAAKMQGGASSIRIQQRRPDINLSGAKIPEAMTLVSSAYDYLYSGGQPANKDLQSPAAVELEDLSAKSQTSDKIAVSAGGFMNRNDEQF